MVKKVLVIQEDIIMRKILKRLVLSLGYTAISLPSLLEFDFSKHRLNFDIIITDILFEGVSPMDFPVQIKEAISQKHLLIVTNMGQEKIKNDILKIEGVDGFFAIPFDLDELEEQLLLLN